MANKPLNTRTEIIQAARNEFLLNGFEGARLQKITDEIGVTKAMIHYYFNTKQELFERVYGESVEQIFGALTEVIGKDIPLFKKIEELIESCLQIAEQHPRVLSFVITESNRKPDWLLPVLEDRIKIDLQVFDNELQKAADNYQIAAVDAKTLIIQVFSLCYYPVLSASVNNSLFNIDSEQGTLRRKGVILDTILNWLTA